MIGTVRRPAHAGSFYPAEPKRLGALVDGLLADATEKLPPLSARSIAGLMVPHAGLIYSGPIAALAWAALREDPPSTIVIAGTNHFGWPGGVEVWTGGAWACPIGDRPVDDALAKRIVALGPPFREGHDVHLGEHSIEVQVPFIARACPEARIVPLLVSPRGGAACERAGEWLGRLLAGLRAAGERIVIVASSDLAHYPAESIAREVDRSVLEPILGLDAPELARRETEIRAEGLPGVDCGLCGLEPVLFTLAAVEEMGATHGLLLGEATSADAPVGDPLRTVGYGAVAFVA